MRRNGAIATASQNSKALLVAGPTGVGKSLFAAELATLLGGEILCADAFQIYEGMAILTAQPGPDLHKRCPHHLYGVVPVREAFNVAQFAAAARDKIENIQARGNRPIIVGGSGLSLRALTEGLSPLPATPPELRDELQALSQEEVVRRLSEIDPAAAQQVDMKNPRRVLRALEICLLTSRPLSESRNQRQPVLDAWDGIFLTRDREELNERIETNVQAMFAMGVVEEVRKLKEVGTTASKAIGLREVQNLLQMQMSEAQCKEQIALATRQYSKRQLTWFRNQCKFLSINLTALRNPQDATASALNFLRGVDE